jgi:hypothetical protein
MLYKIDRDDHIQCYYHVACCLQHVKLLKHGITTKDCTKPWTTLHHKHSEMLYEGLFLLHDIFRHMGSTITDTVCHLNWETLTAVQFELQLKTDC